MRSCFRASVLFKDASFSYEYKEQDAILYIQVGTNENSLQTGIIPAYREFKNIFLSKDLKRVFSKLQNYTSVSIL